MDTNSPLYQDDTVSLTAEDMPALVKVLVESGKLPEFFTERLSSMKDAVIGDLYDFAARQPGEHFAAWAKGKSFQELFPAPEPVQVPVCGRSPVSNPVDGVKPDVCAGCTKTTEERVWDYLAGSANKSQPKTVQEIAAACALSRSAVYYAVTHSPRISRRKHIVSTGHPGRVPDGYFT